MNLACGLLAAASAALWFNRRGALAGAPNSTGGSLLAHTASTWTYKYVKGLRKEEAVNKKPQLLQPLGQQDLMITAVLALRYNLESSMKPCKRVTCQAMADEAQNQDKTYQCKLLVGNRDGHLHCLQSTRRLHQSKEPERLEGGRGGFRRPPGTSICICKYIYIYVCIYKMDTYKQNTRIYI